VTQRDLREINFDSCRVVEIVCEDVECDIRDNLGNLTIRKPGVPNSFQVSIGCTPLLGHNFAGETQRRSVLRGFGSCVASVLDIAIRKASHFADRGVRRHAILASVLLAYLEGDFFSQFGVKGARGKRSAKREIRLQNGGRVRHDPGHVRCNIQLGLNGIEQLFRFAGCRIWVNCRESRHRFLLIQMYFSELTESDAGVDFKFRTKRVIWLTVPGIALRFASNTIVRKTKEQITPSPIEASSLSAIDLFKDLPPSCLRALENESKVLTLRPGHTFFRPGERGQVLFFLEKGRVQTFRTSGRRKLIIAELKPPSVFGEMACVGQFMYHCSAQTTEPSRIRTVSLVQLDALLQRFPSITRRLLELVSERFVRVLLDLDAASFRGLIPRMATFLLQKAEGDCLQGVTHKEIAEYLRVYRESATAALGALRKAGIIAVGRKQIRILDRARLERAARED
jgi:CRP-like cAMP-binding protein